VENDFGIPEDVEFIEENGCMSNADPSTVSRRALERGRPQLGTLGSGNHFIEIGYVETIYDRISAEAMGITEGTVTVSIHSGSRGLGYQVCDDSIGIMIKAAARYGIHLPDRQLCCAPVQSTEGRDYLGAMFAAVNYAFANRQIMAHGVRSVFNEIFGERTAHVRTVYEVAHNIAKIENHEYEGKNRTLCVHRKGATRAFPPGSPHIPLRYRHVGQPVLVPGDMGTNSYILVGKQGAMSETFGSACHGAGRVLSRKRAVKQSRGRSIPEELAQAGVYVMAAGRRTLQEEMPEAYKNVSNVVDAVTGAGLCAKVARLKPLGCLKG
jgi:tRNA-splicing ligase RtcB